MAFQGYTFGDRILETLGRLDAQAIENEKIRYARERDVQEQSNWEKTFKFNEARAEEAKANAERTAQLARDTFTAQERPRYATKQEVESLFPNIAKKLKYERAGDIEKNTYGGRADIWTDDDSELVSRSILDNYLQAENIRSDANYKNQMIALQRAAYETAQENNTIGIAPDESKFSGNQYPDFTGENPYENVAKYFEGEGFKSGQNTTSNFLGLPTSVIDLPIPTSKRYTDPNKVKARIDEIYAPAKAIIELAAKIKQRGRGITAAERPGIEQAMKAIGELRKGTQMTKNDKDEVVLVPGSPSTLELLKDYSGSEGITMNEYGPILRRLENSIAFIESAWRQPYTVGKKKNEQVIRPK